MDISHLVPRIKNCLHYIKRGVRKPGTLVRMYPVQTWGFFLCPREIQKILSGLFLVRRPLGFALIWKFANYAVFAHFHILKLCEIGRQSFFYFVFKEGGFFLFAYKPTLINKKKTLYTLPKRPYVVKGSTIISIRIENNKFHLYFHKVRYSKQFYICIKGKQFKIARETIKLFTFSYNEKLN